MRVEHPHMLIYGKPGGFPVHRVLTAANVRRSVSRPAGWETLFMWHSLAGNKRHQLHV